MYDNEFHQKSLLTLYINKFRLSLYKLFERKTMDIKKIDKAKLAKFVYWLVEGIGLLVLILSLVSKLKLLFWSGKSDGDKDTKDKPEVKK